MREGKQGMIDELEKCVVLLGWRRMIAKSDWRKYAVKATIERKVSA